jgi:multicomponent K+:H+ antiporter subunit A
VPCWANCRWPAAALFDLGVYITVVGATLLMLSVLGAASKERTA